MQGTCSAAGGFRTCCQSARARFRAPAMTVAASAQPDLQQTAAAGACAAAPPQRQQQQQPQGEPAAARPAAASSLAVRLTAADSAELDRLLGSVSTLVLDCDGVLWRGSQLMPGTVEALQRFRQLGKRLLFLTNNSSKSRWQYQRKFESLGIQADFDEIVPTSYAAAAYLQSLGFSGRAFLVGNEGMEQELQAAGIDYTTWEQLCSSGSGASNGDAAAASAATLQQEWTAESFAALQLDGRIGAVVVGWDPAFSYTKLCAASALLRELPLGCRFVATNLDSADNMGNGRMMPGTGCIVHCIETAVGRQAVNVGKGGEWLLPFLCEKYGVRPEEACIVGDRLDTDIALGRVGGLQTVLPLTGVSTQETLAAADASMLPHYVVPNLAALAGIHA